MSLRPVYLTGLIRENPPLEYTAITDPIKRAICLRNSTLGCALYLEKIHQYLLMQDRGGGIWVQHKDCRYIIPPPGGTVFHVHGIAFPLQRWLNVIHRLVRMEGRTSLDSKIPFKYAVQRLYDEQYRNVNIGPNTFSEPLAKRSTLKALNPYIAHRTWISKFLGGLGFTQMLISALTKGLWQHEKRKAMWSNIARMYTYHRDDGTLKTTLEEFIKAQLSENNQDPSPRSFLQNCGINIEDMKKRITPTRIPPNVQTSAVGTVAPTEQTYSEIHDIPNVHFQAPIVSDSTIECNQVEPRSKLPKSSIFTVSKDSVSTRSRPRIRKIIARSAAKQACDPLPTPTPLAYKQSSPDQLPTNLHQYREPTTPVPHHTNQIGSRLCFPPPRSPLSRPSTFNETFQGPGSYSEQEACLESGAYLSSRAYTNSEAYPQLETYLGSEQYQYPLSYSQPKARIESKIYTDQRSFVPPQTYTAPNTYLGSYSTASGSSGAQAPHVTYNPSKNKVDEDFDFTKENTYFISEIYTSENFPQPQLQGIQFSEQEHTYTLR